MEVGSLLLSVDSLGSLEWEIAFVDPSGGDVAGECVPDGLLGGVVVALYFGLVRATVSELVDLFGGSSPKEAPVEGCD